MPSSDVRVDIGRVFALQAAIRALELGLVAARGTQMRVQGALVLVALRALGADVVPGLDSVHVAPRLDREGRVHEAAPGQVTFQMARRRVRAVAEAAAILADLIAVERRRRCNRQRTMDLNGRVKTIG